MERTLFTSVVGNRHEAPWAERLAHGTIEQLTLDQWTAQKSRFVAHTEAGEEVAVALRRPERLHDGDILRYDPRTGRALVVSLALNEVLVIDLSGLQQLPGEERLEHLFELGHAIGNQHWPAVIRSGRVYVPLTVDRKVMLSVIKSHHPEGIECHFEAGGEVIPYLAPHELRRLFGGAEQPAHHNHHTEDEHHPHERD